MKKALALLSSLACLSMAGAVFAQSWPDRPVRLIVPFASGSDTDFLARIVGTHLASVFGQPFVVENRVGAGGAIAAEFVAKSAPDGYTFFHATTPQLQVVPLVQKVNYDRHKDFVPVVNIANSLFLLAIHPSVPAKTLQEFIEYARANPGKLNYGSSGTGTISHLSAALLSRRAGITMTHVPYKGSLPATTDLISGQIQVMFNVSRTFLPYISAGKVVALGVSSEQRARDFPDVPSIAELYPGFKTDAWNGVLAPAKTPRDIVERLAMEISRFVRERSTTETIQKLGLIPSGIVLEEFAKYLQAEEPMWTDAVKAAGIRQE